MHVIGLRGSWQETVEGTFHRHSRNFGRPRSLEANEHVWLVCEQLPAPAEVFVNGRSVGTLAATGLFEADITCELHARNSVVFAVQSDDPLGEVSIQIRGGETPLSSQRKSLDRPE